MERGPDGPGPTPPLRQFRSSSDHQTPSGAHPGDSFQPEPFDPEPTDDTPSNWEESSDREDGSNGDDGFGAGLEAETTEAAAPGATKKKRRRRRSRRSSSGDPASGESSAGDSEQDAEDSRGSAEASGDDAEGPRAEEDDDRAPRRRRRSRKKTASKSEPEEDRDEAPVEFSDDDDEDADEPAPKKRRRRGTRGGRKHKKKRGAAKGGGDSEAVEIETLPGEDDDLGGFRDAGELADLPDDAERVDEDAAGGRRKKKRSRRSKKKSKPKGTTRADDAPEPEGGSKKKKRKRKRSGRRKDDDEDEIEPVEEEPKDRKILVNAGDPLETRVIVVEDGKISDLQMTVKKHVSYVSDIYRGRVVNLEPAIGAAFVDFGQGRNGFLHASDVLPSYGDDDWQLVNLLHTPIVEDADDADTDDADADDDVEAEAEDEDGDEKKPSARTKSAKKNGRRGRSTRRQRRPRLPIEKLLKKGQMVAVQITKDAIGDKGPTLTTYVSIPGRYLVLMPSLERTGVSRKIEDERERRRLKRILTSLEIPEGMGVIVRTAGVGKTKNDIQRDLDYLLLAWEDFSRRLKSGRNPAPLYQESDVAIRTMRDLYTSATEKVVVDDDDVFDRVVEFTRKLMPEHVERIHKHDGARPLFHSYGVEQDFEKIFSRRVELPSGGSIVIDQTEALVAIDVNSGRTREQGADFEDIALKTNLEAAPEIARQIRLRDLGGIIVLDYIDMMRMNNRRKVEKVTREALDKDRARSKIGRISQFGLLELTRQRLGPGLSKLVYDTCPACRGTGRRRSPASRAQAILRRLGTALLLKGFTSVEVRAHPEVIEYLKKNLQRDLDQLENDSGRKLVLLSVPDQVEDSVLHYLRADGREVRPGGRRKR